MCAYIIIFDAIFNNLVQKHFIIFIFRIYLFQSSCTWSALVVCVHIREQNIPTCLKIYGWISVQLRIIVCRGLEIKSWNKS